MVAVPRHGSELRSNGHPDVQVVADKADWRKFEIALAYLIVFILVMYYVFHFR